jgi:hypothetical protein
MFFDTQSSVYVIIALLFIASSDMMLEMVTSVQEWNPSRQAIETHILMDNRQ